jgi:DNA-binding protein Fis
MLPVRPWYAWGLTPILSCDIIDGALERWFWEGGTHAPSALSSCVGRCRDLLTLRHSEIRLARVAVRSGTLKLYLVPSRITAVIAKLEKQRKALDEILVTLHQIEANIVVKRGPHPSLDDHEKNLLATALKRAKGRQSEAARLLGIGRDRLRYKMAKYKLP